MRLRRSRRSAARIPLPCGTPAVLRDSGGALASRAAAPHNPALPPSAVQQGVSMRQARFVVLGILVAVLAALQLIGAGAALADAGGEGNIAGTLAETTDKTVKMAELDA